MSKLKILIILMILNLFCLGCKTTQIKLESLPDYQEQYKNSETKTELIQININHIYDLKAHIFKLWTYILSLDKNNGVLVIDTRDKKSKDQYKKITTSD